MGTIRWHFKPNGIITDGLGNEVTFNKLVKFEDNAVRDIMGNELPINVTDANKLGGKDASEYATKTLLPAIDKPISKVIDGEMILTNTVEEIAYTEMIYHGRGNNPTLPVKGSEKLPNTSFDNTNHIIIENDAGLSVAANELRVNANITDNPAGYMEMVLSGDTVYKVTIELSGDNPAVDVIDPNGNVIMEKITGTGFKVKSFLTTSNGTYRFRMSMNGIGDDDTAVFKNPSVKELDIDNLKHRNFYTVGIGSNLRTEIVTDIPAKDINYSETNVYSNLPKNNLAFFRNDFSMLQYIGDTPGQSGFVRDADNNEIEYFIDVNDQYIGNFDVATDINSFNIIGNTDKAYDSSHAMLLSRNASGGNLEVYFDIETGIGKKFLVSVTTTDVKGEWWIHLGDKVVKNIVMEENEVNEIKFIFDSTTVISRFRIVCTTNETDDTIKVSKVSCKEIDSSIWRDITPTVNGTSTETYEWDSTDIELFALGKELDTEYSVTKYSSLVGKFRRSSVLSNNTGFWLRDNSIIDFTNRGFILGDYVHGSNDNAEMLLKQTSFDKIILSRGVDGKLCLAAFDSAANHAQILVESNGADIQIVKNPISSDILTTTGRTYNGQYHRVWKQFFVYNNNIDQMSLPFMDNDSYNNNRLITFNKDKIIISNYTKIANKNALIDLIGKSTYRDVVVHNSPADIHEIETEFNIMSVVIKSFGVADHWNVYLPNSNGLELTKANDNNTGKITDPGRIFFKNNKLMFLKSDENNIVNSATPSNKYIVELIGKTEDNKNVIKVKRTKLNTKISTTGFTAINSNGVNEKGVVNIVETIDSDAINNITKDNLR